MKIAAAVATVAALILLFPTAGLAHHGVASLGVAGLEGPGAPIETSSSATLPEGSFLAYVKLDRALFEKKTAERDNEGDRSLFWMYGAGYGVKPWLSLYLFAPYNVKTAEDNSYNTAGFADISLTGVFGFKLDEGLRLVPHDESLDDLEDWHFTIYGGLTLPTGDENIRNGAGEIDPGLSLGFGQPSWSVGATATGQLTGRLTGVLDASIIRFRENEYADGAKVLFGDEDRLNAALCLRIWTRKGSKLRIDGNVEGNYLRLGRDEADGIGEEATGGKMLYLLPGVRAYYKNVSVGAGIKFPVWTDLNEEELQQGAEGKEKHRVILSFSALL